MKTFDDYYNKKLKDIDKCAKRDHLTREDFVLKNYHKSIEEFRLWYLGKYEGKGCHSFWHRECINRGIKCNDCIKFFSESEWDKMTIKQKNVIKKS